MDALEAAARKTRSTAQRIGDAPALLVAAVSHRYGDRLRSTTSACPSAAVSVFGAETVLEDAADDRSLGAAIAVLVAFAFAMVALGAIAVSREGG